MSYGILALKKIDIAMLFMYKVLRYILQLKTGKEKCSACKIFTYATSNFSFAIISVKKTFEKRAHRGQVRAPHQRTTCKQ